MPCFNFQCNVCREITEEFYFWEEEPFPKEFPCSCGDGIASRLIAVPTLDSTSKTHRYGVEGYFSKALGKHVESPIAEKKIMEKKGFVCEADLPSHYWEDRVEEVKEQASAQDGYIKNYKEAIKSGKSKQEAAVELAPTHDIMSGKVDKVWNSKEE